MTYESYLSSHGGVGCEAQGQNLSFTDVSANPSDRVTAHKYQRMNFGPQVAIKKEYFFSYYCC